MMKRTIIDVIMFIAVFVGLQVFVTLLAGIVAPLFGVKGDHPMAMVVTSSVANLATIVIFLWRRWGMVGKDFLRARPMATLGWTMAAAAGVVIPSIWLQEQLPPMPDTASEALLKMVHTTGGYFAIAILAPLAEEIVFRGAIVGRLAQVAKNRWAAILVSALLFALVHGNPVQMPHAFVIGVFLGWLFLRTGSIIPGVVFHWMNNTIAYFLTLFMPDPDMKIVELYGGNQQSLLLSILFSLCILVPSVVQIAQRTSTHK